jgi:UDP-N-acetyl-D-mannosaminuronate dehydrogenase
MPYIMHKLEKLGHHPLVILAGCAINDSMPKHASGMMIGD